ncbi:nitroreductase/quinone reductase family protein [Actinoallomurus rhizosphaericola]|uniref:nitroreductase/quinone reductase family protein n=1 Tax=Actinoallomurus rhizosphaericola TaxID=2952536 RepID=UPI00209186CA|nr:nitroreductase/quinone reductase family protein [Actinoallomurus rhizosphaericola]MCO5993155.1 nitroreductase family deazaflavin-dependent oxidoreductase [Actinoallomurus rhizosphaericola]
MTAVQPRHVQAAGFEVHFNKVVHFLTRKGISLLGTRILAVRGRTSGEWRTNPVNVLTYDGVRYLIAPRGHTQWVRNIRVTGGGELRLGRRTEAITVTELPDEEKPALLRQYFKRWGWEVARFFEEDIKKADDERLAAIAATVPVFRID